MPTLPPTAAIAAVAATAAKPAAVEETSPTTGKDGEITAFAVLLTHLATKGEAAASDEHQPEIVGGDAFDTDDGLSAVLASLPGVPLPPPSADDEAALPAAALPEPAGTVMALPVTPPTPAAISAASDATPASAPLSLPVKSHFATASSVEPVANNEDEVIEAETTPTLSTSPGREFATRLSEAIVQAHQSQTPGATANAVQQAIAQHFPAQADDVSHPLIITRPVATDGWNDEIGNRVAWIASQGRSQAELVLTPPHLGRIEVSLTLNGDQAAASFASANPVVRELLEAALPRLREALADAGIQLGQTQIGADHAHQQTHQEKHGQNPAPDPVRDLDTNPTISSIRPGSPPMLTGLKSMRNLVDVFV